MHFGVTLTVMHRWKVGRRHALPKLFKQLRGISLADLTELAGAFTHFESSKRASWWLVRLIALALPVAIMHAVQVRRGDLEPAKTTSNWARFALATVLACATLTFYQRQGTDFIYFQF